VFIEETIVVPATVTEEVELNSAIPISNWEFAYDAVAA
jgi:ribosomal protein L18E